jgi:chromosome segregation ATPase
MMQRAPTPKNEKLAVTIANLERENDNLAARIDELSTRSLVAELDRNDWRDAANDRLNVVGKLQTQLDEAQAKIAKLESVLCGYRQAIADVHGHDVEVTK